MARMRTAHLVAVVALLAPPAVAQAPSWPELEPACAEALAAVAPDPEPEALVQDTHYWASNEVAHWVFASVVDGRGGALVGVGADQNYLLAGWARSELMVPLDFDQHIVNLHFAYGVVFRNAETPEDFVAMWGQSSRDRVSELIVAELPERQAREVNRTFRDAQPFVFRRLRGEVERYAGRPEGSFVTDPTQYAHVRSLWQQGRVFPVRGDLTLAGTVVSAADAMRVCGIPLRVLYLSNAENYFPYNAGFRRGMIAQFFDPRSVVLRTHHTSRYPHPEGEPDYHYNFQSGSNLVGWMLDRSMSGLWEMLAAGTQLETVGLSAVLETSPRLVEHMRRMDFWSPWTPVE